MLRLAERVPVNLSTLYPATIEIAEKPSGPRIHTVIGGASFVPAALPEKKKVEEEATGRGTRDVGREKLEEIKPAVVLTEATGAIADPLVAQMAETAALNAKTHEAYLQFANTMEKTLTENINLQMS